MTSSFYTGNRRRLYQNLPDASLFVLCSGGVSHRTADDDYRFFANRNFVYLTGIAEPDCMLFAYRLHGQIHETLYIRDMDPAAEVRGGRRITREEARAASGMDDIAYRSAFEGMFHKLARDIYFQRLYLCLEANTGQEATDPNHHLYHTAAQRYPNLKPENAFPFIARQRTIKSAEELANIRGAMDITREGILRMMRACRGAGRETDLFAEFMYVIHRHGAVEPAFKPIVSCGANNFFLHYDTPSGLLADGELCLADVGAIVDFCCVDISRVFPRDGTFTPRQRDVYAISLDANDEITAEIKAGMAFPEIDRLYRQRVFPGLKALGLLSDPADLDRYVWHGCTHHVGLDVHDVGSYQTPIEKGMVFTVDTGIYIREWGLGMRIEDNVLATDDGLTCLSAGIPRRIDEIEAAMA